MTEGSRCASASFARQQLDPRARCGTGCRNRGRVARAKAYSDGGIHLARLGTACPNSGAGWNSPGVARRATACSVSGSSARRGRLLSSQSPSSPIPRRCGFRGRGPCRTAAAGAARHRPTSIAAASGRRSQRAAASAISTTAAAGSTGTPSTAWSASHGTRFRIEMIEPERHRSRLGETRAAGGRTAGLSGCCPRPCARTRSAPSATGKAAGPRGSAGPSNACGAGDVVAGDMAARGDRRKRILAALLAAQRAPAPGPAPSAARSASCR